MVKENMFITVKTLLEKGNTISEIAKNCHLDRKTVRSIRNKINQGKSIQEKSTRSKKLDPYIDLIHSKIELGWSADQIHDHFLQQHIKTISYSTVQRYVKAYKGSEAYAPIITEPGEEAQVDFGYAGKFLVEGRRKKCWLFCFVLCFSRYAYYELVTDQKADTFHQCHRHAFEQMRGCPKSVRLDNLKSGVLSPDWYE